jgi:hypothetical protein
MRSAYTGTTVGCETYLLESYTRNVCTTMAQMCDSDARHSIKILFPFDLRQNGALTRFEDYELSRPLFHEEMTEPVHLVRLIGGLRCGYDAVSLLDSMLDPVVDRRRWLRS